MLDLAHAESKGNERRVALSEYLEARLFGFSAKNVSVGDVLGALGVLAPLAITFLFAALNVIPAPPGTSLILGSPLVLIAAQRAFGLPLWMPDSVLRASLERQRFEAGVLRILPWLRWIESFIKPRGQWHRVRHVQKSIDWFMLLLALTVLIPLPFTAMGPAFCLCILALARMEGDGRFLAIGLALGATAILVLLGVVFAMVKLMKLLMIV